MQVKPIKTEPILPPQDDLLSKIKRSKLKLKEGDLVAVTSKVVSIWQGRTVREDEISDKLDLSIKEADYYLERKKGTNRLFTIKNNALVTHSGIDSSNGDGYYVLWPEEPQSVAKKLLRWFKKEYKVKDLCLIITDSRSMPLRRGAIGFALAWAGFDPLLDNRGKQDIFGRKIKAGQANLADAFAAAAVLVMGEAGENTPIAVISGAPNLKPLRKKTRIYSSFEVPFEEDIFSQFINIKKWKKGGGGEKSGGKK